MTSGGTSGESTERYASAEQARNAAVRWLERQGVVFDGRRRVLLARLPASPLRGREVGVSGDLPRPWSLRVDDDPRKGPHYNAAIGKGAGRRKMAFLFPGPRAASRTAPHPRDPR